MHCMKYRRKNGQNWVGAQYVACQLPLSWVAWLHTLLYCFSHWNPFAQSSNTDAPHNACNEDSWNLITHTARDKLTKKYDFLPTSSFLRVTFRSWDWVCLLPPPSLLVQNPYKKKCLTSYLWEVHQNPKCTLLNSVEKVCVSLSFFTFKLSWAVLQASPCTSWGNEGMTTLSHAASYIWLEIYKIIN